jgi:hypothetical protein
MKSILLLFAFQLVFTLTVDANNHYSIDNPIDSSFKRVDSTEYAKSNNFYDGLLHKTKKSNLSQLIIKSLFVGTEWRNPDATTNRLILEKQYYSGYVGRKIRNIYVYRANIFNANDSIESPLEKWHVLTREKIIRRNLFFKSGEVIDAEAMVRNEQYLRSLNFLSDAYILLQSIDYKQVDIFVYTRDNLSLSPGFSSQSVKQIYTYASESNMFGTGNKFEIGVLWNSEGSLYRGFSTEYQFHNLGGKFVNLDLLANKNYNDSRYRMALNKEFLNPSDFAGGVLFDIQKKDQFFHNDSAIANIGTNNLEIWVGKSHRINQLAGNIFLTTAFSDTRFQTPSNISKTANPNYSNRQNLLFSTGIYRENFYRGNLIYGFGKSEDIPFGYKLECIGGYSWSEFSNRWYFASKLQAASITHFGYLRGKIELGNYIYRSTKQFEQSTLSFESSYFTNLIYAGRWGIRNFLVTKYMRGFNRLIGEGENLYYSAATLPRAILDYESKGDNRLSFGAETVGFSPLYIQNFRFAFYGYTDWAWLGYSKNVFQNDYCSSIGFGIRIKNERLIFQTIQIRIGFSLHHSETSTLNWLDVSEEARMKSDRLIPGRASVVDYR